MNLPVGWRSITVGTALEPLPEATQESIVTLLRSPGPDSAKVRELKKLLAPHAAILEQHGIVADYLAYVLAYSIKTLLPESTTDNP